MMFLVFLAFLYYPFLLFSAPADKIPAWNTEGIEKSIQYDQTMAVLEDTKDCQPSSAESSLFLAQNTLELVERRRKNAFVCEVGNEISRKNGQVMRDRKFIFKYINKQKEGLNHSLSKEDHLHMTALLIKYRLLRNKKGKEYYVSSTRWTPPEGAEDRIFELAEEYIEEQGQPKNCFFVRKNRVKKGSLTGKDCVLEIIRKVQAIPAPLILAQAVLESGWGLSSLAQEEKNILGLQVMFSQPSSMDEYPNCRRAHKDPRRCLLKFSSLKGSIYEYYNRFNASHFPGYQNYRRARLDLYSRDTNYNSCDQSIVLSEHIDFYAENKMYVNKVQNMTNRVCSLLKECGDNSLIAGIVH